MFKFSIAITSLLFSLSAAAALELACEGWHQEQGAALNRVTMAKAEQTNLNWKQSTEISGYKYDVNWDVNLDTFYVTISQSGNSVLFTTARVPTFTHNDSFTDLNLPSELRLSVSCMFKN